MTDPTVARVELHLRGEWPIDQLTIGWTEKEKAAIFEDSDAGDEAREALFDEAQSQTRQRPDEVDVWEQDLR